MYWELRKDPGFSHIDFPTLWWPLTCRSCTCFLNLHSLPCDPGWFWWCLPSVLTIHIWHRSSLLQFYCLNRNKCSLKLFKYVYAIMSCECLYIFSKLCPHFQPMYDTLSEERKWYELIKASRKRAEGPVTWTLVLSWTSSTSELKLALTCHWFNVHTWYLFCTCLMPYSCCTVSLMTDSFFKLSFVSKVFRIKQKSFMWSLNPSSAFLSVLAFTCFIATVVGTTS